MSTQGTNDEGVTHEGSVAGSTQLPPKPKPKTKTTKRKPMAKRSPAWDHFEAFEDEEKHKKARCIHCSKEYYSDPKTNGTSNLMNHLSDCKNLNATFDKSQGLLNFQSIGESGEVNIVTWKFDKAEVRRALALMIMIDELSFKFVESEGFRYLMSVACGPKFVMPSRWTVSRDCFNLYIEEKNLLKGLLKSSKQRVCLTTDTWSSLQRINYMCLTAHYIDSDWKLTKKILNFCPISSHKGKDIGLGVEKCLNEWGIDRVFTITVDNASSNDSALAYLKEQIGDWNGSVHKCEFMHMRCIAHIINLGVTDGLKEIGGSVKKIRNAVRYMRQSPARLKKFKECIEHEKIKSKSLLCLDVATRWNSTYLMLESAQKFEKAFNRYDSQDLSYSIELQVDEVRTDGIPPRKVDGTPWKEDWEKARKMMKFLKVFYEITIRISGSKYVTSNLFFREIYMIHILLTDWISSKDAELCVMAKKMKEKYDKYWGDPKKMNKVVFIAVILDPRYKFEWVQFALSNMYGVDVGFSMGSEVKNLLLSLYTEYKQEIMPENPNEQSGTSQQSIKMDIDDPQLKAQKMIDSEFKRFKTGMGGRSSKSELEKYLNEETEEEGSKFDILTWWKVNSLRFPILAQIAHDILAVPISTVASESTFCTGGRVLDAFRSSLTSKVVQALICGQDWLRKSCTPISVEEKLDEIENLDKDLQGIAFESSIDP